MRSLLLAVVAALAGAAVTLWLTRSPPNVPAHSTGADRPDQAAAPMTARPEPLVGSAQPVPAAPQAAGATPSVVPASGSDASSPTRAPGAPSLADPAVSEAFRGQLEVADRNGDSLISREEAGATMPDTFALFDRMDVDHDGQLSEADMQAFTANSSTLVRDDLERRFAEADLDGDEALDLAEAQTGLPIVAANFMLLDADNDGRVSLEELRTRGRRKR